MSLNIRKLELPDNSVTTEKLVDGAVTVEKSDNLVKLRHFFGDEIPDEQTGTVEKDSKSFNFITKPSVIFSKLKIVTRMKTSDALHKAILNIYLNGDPSPIATLETNSITFETLVSDIDFSTVADGKHEILMTIFSADASSIAYLDMYDVYQIP